MGGSGIDDRNIVPLCATANQKTMYQGAERKVLGILKTTSDVVVAAIPRYESDDSGVPYEIDYTFSYYDSNHKWQTTTCRIPNTTTRAYNIC